MVKERKVKILNRRLKKKKIGKKKIELWHDFFTSRGGIFSPNRAEDKDLIWSRYKQQEEGLKWENENNCKVPFFWREHANWSYKDKEWERLSY